MSTEGTLYVVATPIGNVEDVSERARRVLSQAALIAAEDTRRTRTLLSLLGLDRPLESYHRHSEAGKAEALVAVLKAGRDVALVTDAGVPVISDPGWQVVARAWEEGLRVCPIPGPSAALSALSVSGFNADRFLFAGYPPRKRGDRRAFYRDLAQTQVPAVIYEAPHRLRESLEDAVAEVGGDRPALLAREMTKRFEELRRGPLSELRRHYDQVEPRGELTLVLGPAPRAPADAAPPAGDALQAARLLLAAQLPTRTAAAILSAATGMSRKAAYALLLAQRADG